MSGKKNWTLELNMEVAAKTKYIVLETYFCWKKTMWWIDKHYHFIVLWYYLYIHVLIYLSITMFFFTNIKSGQDPGLWWIKMFSWQHIFVRLNLQHLVLYGQCYQCCEVSINLNFLWNLSIYSKKIKIKI